MPEAKFRGKAWCDMHDSSESVDVWEQRAVAASTKDSIEIGSKRSRTEMESGALPTLLLHAETYQKADGSCGSLCERVQDCSVSSACSTKLPCSEPCADTTPWAARAKTRMLERVEPCSATEGGGTRSDADTRVPTQARDAVHVVSPNQEAAPTALSSQLRPGQVIARQMCKPLEDIIRGLDQQSEKKARHNRVAPESTAVNSGMWEAISQTPTTVAQEALNADDAEWETRLQKRIKTIDTLKQSEKYIAAVQRGVAIPEAPDPYDRTFSKRFWETAVQEWKSAWR